MVWLHARRQISQEAKHVLRYVFTLHFGNGVKQYHTLFFSRAKLGELGGREWLGVVESGREW